MNMKKRDWHSLEIEETAKILETNLEKGIDSKEVEARQRVFGENILPEDESFPSFRIFLAQFKSPLIYILIIAGLVTLFFQEFTDSIVIFGSVFLNIIVGFIQERKASRTLSELKKVAQHNSKVLRGGKLRIIDSKEVIPGDIVILEPGDRVPADGRLFFSEDLMINEMALTGEWLPAKKNVSVLEEKISLADRDNMIYMGCVVEGGKGKAIITDIGVFTEIGRIAQMLKESKEEKTPYQKKLAHFSKIVGIIIAILCFSIFLLGLISGRGFSEMFITSVAIAVAAIPEGLPVAMTVILALGMQRILKKKGLVRKLASAETLGSTSVIATDKTATLTEGRMKVGEVFGEEKTLLKIAFLISEAFVENPDDSKREWIIRGRPTDKAFLEGGIDCLGQEIIEEKEKNIVSFLPFNSVNKMAAVVFQEKDDLFLYVGGAPEIILERSSLDKEKRNRLEDELDKLAGKGLRIVAGAWKKIDNFEKEKLKEEANALHFSGFITLEDPVREEAKEAINVCKEAGMKPIIVTGDHKLTARAVAQQLGLRVKDEEILKGEDLDKLSKKEFHKIIDKIQIYARVEPRHKLRIIKAWQDRGNVVAMTGDGINDAPALKKADIGVSLGSGTEVAKESSDLVLLNDSFSIIVSAVEEGRLIIDNIRKVITYLLSDSFTEVLLIGGSMVLAWITGKAWILPITAVQILWVNLVEDGLPGISLAFEKKERDIMKRKSGEGKAPLLTREMKVIIFVIGLTTDLILLLLFFFLWNKGYDVRYIQTMIFTALSVDSLFYIFSCKSLRKNIWKTDLFSNFFLIFSWIVGFIMLLIALYIPFFQYLLKTVPLGFFDWLIIIGLGMVEIILIEITKHHFIIKKEMNR